MSYFDTAYVLKCYVHEPGSSYVRSLLEKQGAAACCAYGRLELTAAVVRAIREGRLDQRVLPTVFSVLNRDDHNGVWTWLPLTSNLLERAADLLRTLPQGAFVRAGDALHMTCALVNFGQSTLSPRSLCSRQLSHA